MCFNSNADYHTSRAKNKHLAVKISAPRPILRKEDLNNIHRPLPIGDLAKFPSPPPPIELHNAPLHPYPLSSLSSHSSSEPSSFASPQPPTAHPDFPAPLNVQKKNTKYTGTLYIGSSILTTTGEFINAPGKQLYRVISGAPSSFVQEVNDYFDPPDSPPPDLGFDKHYDTNSERERNTRVTSVLNPRLGRIDRETKSNPLNLTGIQAGPYSSANSRASAQTLEPLQKPCLPRGIRHAAQPNFADMRG